MKNLLLFLVAFIPLVLMSQVTQKNITESLPKGAKYKLINTKHYKQTLKRTKRSSQKRQIGDSVHIGCSKFEKQGLPIAFSFAVREKGWGKKREMLLYAVKRENYQFDEEIINALDVYCYYGQANYYFMSKKYILFTNSIGGDFLAIENEKLLTKIVNQLVKNLNEISSD